MDVDADVTPVADTAAAAAGAVADDCTAVDAAAKILRSRRVSTFPTLSMARPAPLSKPPMVVKVFMVLP